MIDKSAFIQEVERIMNECDNERALSFAIGKYCGETTILSRVSEMAFTAMKYMLLNITGDLSSAVEEANWFVFATDFGRNVPNITDIDNTTKNSWGKLSIGAYYDYLETVYIKKQKS